MDISDKNTLTVERLRELLHYDPETGLFTRLVTRPGRGARAGNAAGSVSHRGYRRIRLDHTTPHLAHRLAFLYMTGRWPKHDVDHINLDTSDNRWKNLREATRAQNKQNGRAYKKNPWGAKGVSIFRHRFLVNIQANSHRRRIHCPPSSTLGEAADLYADLAKELHGEFSRVE